MKEKKDREKKFSHNDIPDSNLELSDCKTNVVPSELCLDILN